MSAIKPPPSGTSFRVLLDWTGGPRREPWGTQSSVARTSTHVLLALEPNSPPSPEHCGEGTGCHGCTASRQTPSG